MFMPDEDPSPGRACEDCGHSLDLHDEDGCLDASCDCEVAE